MILLLVRSRDCHLEDIMLLVCVKAEVRNASKPFLKDHKVLSRTMCLLCWTVAVVFPEQCLHVYKWKCITQAIFIWCHQQRNLISMYLSAFCASSYLVFSGRYLLLAVLPQKPGMFALILVCDFMLDLSRQWERLAAVRGLAALNTQH